MNKPMTLKEIEDFVASELSEIFDNSLIFDSALPVNINIELGGIEYSVPVTTVKRKVNMNVGGEVKGSIELSCIENVDIKPPPTPEPSDGESIRRC